MPEPRQFVGLEETGTDNGTAIVRPDQPVRADTWDQWQIVYTVGGRGIEVGGSVKITIPHSFSRPQLIDPKAGGYVTVGTSRPDVEIRCHTNHHYVTSMTADGHTGIYGKDIFVRVAQGRLDGGDTVTVVYGDRSGGGPGARAQYFEQRVPFMVATDTDGKRSGPFTGYFLIAESPWLQVIGGPATHLAVITDSVVMPGEGVRCAVIARDQDENTAGDYRGQIALDDHMHHTFTSSDRGVHVFTNVKTESTRVEMIDKEHGLRATSNPIRIARDKMDNKVFWGDIHTHSFPSDGMGRPEDAYTYAKSIARLDFCSVSDHAMFHPYVWGRLCEASAAFNRPGEFVTFAGFEIRTERGDVNVYYPHDDGEVLIQPYDARTDYWHKITFDKLHAFAREHGAMLIPHLHAHADWDIPSPSCQRLVEIYSCWGNHEEAILTPRASRSGFTASDTFRVALSKGHKLGATAGSDCHAGHPGHSDWLRIRRGYWGGLTAVYAGELTREAIWQALWNRHCYATTGARILLNVTLNGHTMGREVTLADDEKPTLDVTVAGTAALRDVAIIKNSQELYAYETPNHDATFRYVDESHTPDAAAHYYIRVMQDDTELAWSSPLWIEPRG